MSRLPVDMLSARPPRIFWPILALSIVVSVYGIALFILYMLRLGNGWFSAFSLAAALAALLVGLPAWWQFVVRPQHATVARGVLVGGIGSIIAHPVMWTTYMVLGGVPFFFSGPIVGPLEMLSAVAGDTTLSLIYAGWITFPCGCIIGMLLIRFQLALTRASQRRSDREAEAMRLREMGGIEQAKKR